MPNYDYKCTGCEITVVEFRSYEERDLGGQCDICHAPRVRAFNSAPGQMNTALPDGTKRKGFETLKEAAKLEAESFDSRPAERKILEGEINKLRGIKK